VQCFSQYFWKKRLGIFIRDFYLFVLIESALNGLAKGGGAGGDHPGRRAWGVKMVFWGAKSEKINKSWQKCKWLKKRSTGKKWSSCEVRGAALGFSLRAPFCLATPLSVLLQLSNHSLYQTLYYQGCSRGYTNVLWYTPCTHDLILVNSLCLIMC